MVEYVRPNGRNPFREWHERLDSEATVKVNTAIERLKQGNDSRLKWISGIGELIVDWGPGYRIYLAEEGESVVLLFGGGVKRTQQADIDRARLLKAEHDRKKWSG